LALASQRSNQVQGYTRKTEQANRGDDSMKRILVSLPEGIFKIVKELKGTLGDSDSEVVRDIVVAYLSEQGYLAKGGKQ
jgi:hypothetical protein